MWVQIITKWRYCDENFHWIPLVDACIKAKFCLEVVLWDNLPFQRLMYQYLRNDKMIKLGNYYRFLLINIITIFDIDLNKLDLERFFNFILSK